MCCCCWPVSTEKACQEDFAVPGAKFVLPPDPPDFVNAYPREEIRHSGSQEPKSSFGYKSFQGGRRTERTFISTHLVEAGWARVPGGGAKLGNEPQTDAGSSAERITDQYINLEF